jgi:hypothetical protein
VIGRSESTYADAIVGTKAMAAASNNFDFNSLDILLSSCTQLLRLARLWC